MNLADPIDRAVAIAFRGPVLKDRVHQSAGAGMLEEAMSAEAGTAPPLVDRVARIIYSYDQDFVDRPWARLGEGSRQTYYEIAEAVIREIGRVS